MAGRAKKYCLAAGCYNNNKNSKCTFFALPSGQEDDERCRKWLTLLGRKDMLKNDSLRKRSYSVCCTHFDDSQIKIVKTLVKGCLPTLHLANPDGVSSSQALDVQVPAIASSDNAVGTPASNKIVKRERISTEQEVETPSILSSESAYSTSVKMVYNNENITIKSEPISTVDDDKVPAVLSSEGAYNTPVKLKYFDENISIKSEPQQEAEFPAIQSLESAENAQISNFTVANEPKSIKIEVEVPASLSLENAVDTSVPNIAKLNSEVTPVELEIMEMSTQAGSFLTKRQLSDGRKKKRTKKPKM